MAHLRQEHRVALESGGRRDGFPLPRLHVPDAHSAIGVVPQDRAEVAGQAQPVGGRPLHVVDVDRPGHAGLEAEDHVRRVLHVQAQSGVARGRGNGSDPAQQPAEIVAIG